MQDDSIFILKVAENVHQGRFVHISILVHMPAGPQGFLDILLCKKVVVNSTRFHRKDWFCEWYSFGGLATLLSRFEPH